MCSPAFSRLEVIFPVGRDAYEESDVDVFVEVVDYCYVRHFEQRL